ncbi:hypothetical protein CCH79_00013627 [Gambusia affinis]|uniref:Uncharacterized protein n=1 Tax=Gambusia affinis TaxID=33528 RepID=A0A315WCS0_GAMAF|nr:hypothetical protein CCH79_00013627 [Gambusia affinis]
MPLAAGFHIMAQFAEVLNQVRLVLTVALPGEVHALLEGLVEEGIISEAYRNSLNLHWLNDGIVPKFTSKPGCVELDEDLNSPGSVAQLDLNQKPMSQVRTGGSKSLASDHNVEQTEPISLIKEPNNTRLNLGKNKWLQHENLQRNQEEMQELLEEVLMDLSCLNQDPLSLLSVYDCTLRSSDEKAELLSGASTEHSCDNESINKGNEESEEVWLQQVEESARRIAVPLWQNWDRGRGMLQTLLPCVPNGCSISDRMMPEGEAQSAILDMKEEMELAAACSSLDACVGDFECEELSFACDTDAGRSEREALHFSTLDGVAVFNTDDSRVLAATRDASPVEACKATEARYITQMLEGQFDVLCPVGKMADKVDDLFCFTADAPYQQCGTRSGLSENTFRDLLHSDVPEDSRTVLQDTSLYSLTEGLKDYLEDAEMYIVGLDRELQEKTDLHCGAFQSPPLLLLSRTESLPSVDLLICQAFYFGERLVGMVEHTFSFFLCQQAADRKGGEKEGKTCGKCRRVRESNPRQPRQGLKASKCGSHYPLRHHSTPLSHVFNRVIKPGH